ncbi:MAG: hypothetical protein ABFD04_11695 [Syntrophomonas sp.]
MDYNEIINQQITLLADLNQKLTGMESLEAAREIRENAKTIADLIKAKEVADIELLEMRIIEIEDCLLGKGENTGLVPFVKGLEVTQEDHEERLNTIEARTDPDVWGMLQDDDDLPDDYPWEQTLGGLIERVSKLEDKLHG